MKEKKGSSMEKTMKNNPSFTTKDLTVEICCNYEEEVDRIGELPDDILVSILSILTLREAAAAKTLSSRWRRLQTTPNVVLLEYPFPLVEQNHGYWGRYLTGDAAQFPAHISWINETLDSYVGGDVIKEFRVDIPCTGDVRFAKETELSRKLLEFALSRETEVIDIRFVYPAYRGDYYLSTSIIKNSASPRSPLHGLRCLKELSLRGVSMYNDGIKVLLQNLVVLERLVLESLRIRPYYCKEWDDYFGHEFYIDGPPTSKLQTLIISGVSGDAGARVTNLTNLVSLRWDGMCGFSTVDLHNLPNLVHLRIHSVEDCILGQGITKISCNGCDQLRRLEFTTRLDKYVVDGNKVIVTSGRHSKRFFKIDFELRLARDRLRHLEMNVVLDKEECDLHRLFSLIEACPHLNKLEIKLIWVVKPKYRQRIRVDEDLVNYRVTTIDHLRTMKLSEFCGTLAELEFVLCVLNSGVDLQELTIEACASNSAIQQREIANSYKHLLSLAPTFVDLILK